ncbi:MAG: molybdopterin molybdotransferase MoeA [Candidatus Omnitrophica bacterium]|nr:molybdopterin molybdotransferase MoeA [Candidatus Omnitrophota bacterium]
MLTVKEAESIILASVKEFPCICVPLAEAFGRVSREDIFADRDLPPFDRVTMDGIAIDSGAWARGARQFPVAGVQKAGGRALSLKDRNACFEIMTGAILPQGCDCVIPVEHIVVDGGLARVSNELAVAPRLNVQPRASERKKGELLVRRGTPLFPAQIAVAAAVGKSRICVARAPAVAVIGTGDELVPLNARTVKPFQVRESNAYALQAGLELNGYPGATRFHVRDNLKTIESRLRKVLRQFDVIILSGGVSMGKFDFVPRALGNLGVKVLFHKVRQRPGGPFWFGKTKSGKPVFALPGNPVSSHVCLYRYVLPYLRKAGGLEKTARRYVVLDEPVEIKTALTYFLPVRLTFSSDGKTGATPVFLRGSGDYAALGESDGFIELPSDTCRFARGSAHRFYPTNSPAFLT